jgi:hypothetical protein
MIEQLFRTINTGYKDRLNVVMRTGTGASPWYTITENMHPVDAKFWADALNSAALEWLKAVNESRYMCPSCEEIDNGDVTIEDHGVCWGCHQEILHGERCSICFEPGHDYLACPLSEDDLEEWA